MTRDWHSLSTTFENGTAMNSVIVATLTSLAPLLKNLNFSKCHWGTFYFHLLSITSKKGVGQAKNSWNFYIISAGLSFKKYFSSKNWYFDLKFIYNYNHLEIRINLEFQKFFEIFEKKILFKTETCWDDVKILTVLSSSKALF